VCLLVLNAAPAARAAESTTAIAFTDQRPISGAAGAEVVVEICNLTPVDATPRVFLSSVDGEPSPLIATLSPTTLAAGQCGEITVAAPSGSDPVAFDGTVVATLAGTLISRPLILAAPAATTPPAPPNDSVAFQATKPWNTSGALPSDTLVPIALNVAAEKVQAPAPDAPIGVLQHGSATVTVFVKGKPRVSSPGVVSLPVRAAGFVEIGDYTGILNLAASGQDPIVVEMTVHSTKKDWVKWFFILLGVFLGALAVWFAEAWRPYQRLTTKIGAIEPNLTAAVAALNTSYPTAPTPPFTVDAEATSAHVTQLEALRDKAFVWRFVDTKRPAYKQLVTSLEAADKNVVAIHESLPKKLTTLREGLGQLDDAYPDPPAVDGAVSRPLFVDQIDPLVSTGRALGPKSATGLEEAVDGALALVAAWKKRAELYATLRAKSTAGAAAAELSTARQLLIGAADRQLDTPPIDAALGRAWFLISDPPTPPPKGLDVRFVEVNGVEVAIAREAGALSKSIYVYPATTTGRAASGGLIAPIRDLASVGGSLATGMVIVLGVVSAWYLSVETVIDDETFGSVGDYARALGLGGLFSAALTTGIAAVNKAARAEPDPA
jgi:hypothetical protein